MHTQLLLLFIDTSCHAFSLLLSCANPPTPSLNPSVSVVSGGCSCSDAIWHKEVFISKLKKQGNPHTVSNYKHWGVVFEAFCISLFPPDVCLWSTCDDYFISLFDFEVNVLLLHIFCYFCHFIVTTRWLSDTNYTCYTIFFCQYKTKYALAD